MGNRPQTLYGLADSPVALAAWMLDHDAYSLEDIATAFDGDPVDNLTRDEVLDNITMTWLTNTGVSSGRLYWENTLGFFDIKGVKVPAAVSVFPRELYQAPRSWTEQAYPNLIYFNELDRGNHFAAWQEPDLFAAELRAAFRSAAADGVATPSLSTPHQPARSDPLHRPSPGGRAARPAGRGPAGVVRRRDRLAQLRAADAGGASRPRRPRRLLDLHLRQLAAHAAVRPGLGREVRATPG